MSFEAIGQTLDPLKARFKFQLPDSNQMRVLLPELELVTDAAIMEKICHLQWISEARQKCSPCTGYENCWRAGDSMGKQDVIHVLNGEIDIRGDYCQPYLEHAARAKNERMIQEAGMTKTERGYTFQNFPKVQNEKHPDLYNAALRFSESYQVGQEVKGVYIFGPPGVAKTHLALSIINNLIDRGVPSVFVVTSALVEKHRVAKFKSEGEYHKMLYHYGTIPVLALDEFAQSGKDFAVEVLVDVLSMRAASHLPTFFTSNIAPPEVFGHLMGDAKVAPAVSALRSRIGLVADGGVMAGKDHRLANLKVFMPKE